MISLRTHIASLVAILLALAAGVALGAGPLQKDRNQQAADLTQARSALATARDTSTSARKVGTFTDSYVRDTATGLLAKRLGGRDVALVALPGADPGAVSGVQQLVGAAGGRVTGTVQVTAKAVQPGGRQLVDALTTQMAAQSPSLAVPTGMTTYERLGYVLGRGLGTTGRTASYDATAVGLVAGLDTAGLARTPADPSARAGLVVVVAGDKDSAAGRPAAEHDLVSGMATAVRGLALLAPTPAGGAAGVLGLVAKDAPLAAKVATVDPAGTAAGQAVAVLALVRLADGKAGSWGASGTDGAVPSLK